MNPLTSQLKQPISLQGTGMPLQPAQQPPSHLSERVFRAYEKHILSVVQKYPNPVTIDPKPLSNNTFKGRLRDAIRSLLLYHWSSPIDVARLGEIRSEIAVTDEAGLVRVGPPTVQSQKIDGDCLADTPITTSTITCDKADNKDLYAFAHLLGRRLIPGPIRFTNTSSEEVSKLVDLGFDVSFREEAGVIYLF